MAPAFKGPRSTSSLTPSFLGTMRLTKAEQAASRHTASIDAEIAQAKRARWLGFSIVVLGEEGSGKSTLLRQVEFQHAPLSDAQRMEYKDGVTACLEHSLGQRVPLEEQDRTSSPRPLIDSPHQQYFLNSASRIASAEYIPTDDDIVRLPQARLPVRSYTTDALTQNISFELTALSSTLGKHRKWLYYLGDVDAIVYMVDLTAYGRTVVDQETGENVNALQYDLRRLQELSVHRALAWKPFTIIFSKLDIFMASTTSTLSTVRRHFPDFPGSESQPVTSAAAYACIAERYRRIIETRDRLGTAPLHACDVLDQDTVRNVLSLIADFVLRSRLRVTCGL
ncbi:G-protein alpha subunit-domain-containing protein [Mycena amicta]|nr:G-protein alpha subunit-domain-containing protein [Mycena amicta]